MLLMLSSSGAARAALLAVGFLTVLFYNVVLITHDKTLDFGKLSGFIYFSGVILFCFTLSSTSSAACRWICTAMMPSTSSC